MAGKSKPTVVIVQDGDKFDIKLSTMIFTRDEVFEVGKTFEQDQLDGSTYTVKNSAIAVLMAF